MRRLGGLLAKLGSPEFRRGFKNASGEGFEDTRRAVALESKPTKMSVSITATGKMVNATVKV